MLQMMAGRMLPFADAYSLQPLACCHLGPSVRVRPGAVVLNSVALGHGGIGPGENVNHDTSRHSPAPPNHLHAAAGYHVQMSWRVDQSLD